jgi:hypothetical protein
MHFTTGNIPAVLLLIAGVVGAFWNPLAAWILVGVAGLLMLVL